MAKPVRVAVVGDASQLKRELDLASGNVDTFSKRAVSAAKTFVGVFAVAGFFRAGLDELKEAQQVSAQTAAVLKSTGGAANVTAEDVANLAGELSNLSGKDDELIQKGANLLLTFRNVRNEVGAGNDVFDRANRAALDLSVAGFGDLTQTSKLLGVALNDPRTGITRLTRAGVTFTKEQKETIRTLVETGNILEAQKLILEEVEAQVGGSAKAYGETLPGKIERARTAFDNMAGSVLASTAPALESLASIAATLAEAFSDLPEPLQTAIVFGGLGAVAFKKLGISFDQLAISAFNGVGALERFGPTVAGIAGPLGGFAVAIGVASVATAAIADSVNGDIWGTFARDTERVDLALKELGSTGRVIGILNEQLPTLVKGFESTDAGLTGFLDTALEVGARLPGITGLASQFGNAFERGFDIDSADKFRNSVDALDKRLVELFRVDPTAGVAAFEALRNQLVLMGVPVDTVNAAFDDFAAVQEDASESSDAVTQSIEAELEAVKALNDEIRAAVDPFFKLTKAHRDNADAQKAVTDAELALFAAQQEHSALLRQYGDNHIYTKAASDRLAEAQRNLADAQADAADSGFDVQEATRELEVQLRTHNITTEDAIEHIQGLADQNLITKDTAQQLQTQFFLLGLQIGQTPDKKDIHVSSPGLQDTIDGWRRLGDGIWRAVDGARVFQTGPGVGIVTKGPGIGTEVRVPGSATGGWAGTGWHWVGERGPELINVQGGGARVQSAEVSRSKRGGPTMADVYLDGEKVGKALLRSDGLRKAIRAGALS